MIVDTLTIGIRGQRSATDHTFWESRDGRPYVHRETLVRQPHDPRWRGSRPRYLCWDSFRSSWFWGPQRLAERFTRERARVVADELCGQVATPKVRS